MVGVVNIYGPHDDAKKLSFWNCLRGILMTFYDMWCIFEDFNEVRGQGEKLNSVLNARASKYFNDFIHETCLIDLPIGG